MEIRNNIQIYSKMKRFIFPLISLALLVAGCKSVSETENNIMSRIIAEELQAQKFEAYSTKAATDSLVDAAATLKSFVAIQNDIVSQLKSVSIPEKEQESAAPAQNFSLKETKENLAEASLSLSIEISSVYDQMIKKAVEDKNDAAKGVFEKIIALKQQQKNQIDSLLTK